MTARQGYNAFGDAFPTSTSSTHQMNPEVFEQLKQLAGNQKCVDCGTNAPDWGSPKLGVFMCFQCSGIHRGLGVHVSFVRSVHMDHWEESQIQLMRVGGNDQCNAFLRERGIDSDSATPTNDLRQHIRQKYDSDAAFLYQQVLKAKVEGTPIPTKLTKPRQSNRAPMRKMEGFGSSPPPPAAATGVSNTTKVVCVVGVVAAAAIWALAPQ